MKRTKLKISVFVIQMCIVIFNVLIVESASQIELDNEVISNSLKITYQSPFGDSPVEISDPFGLRKIPVQGASNDHKGVDIRSSKAGAKILSISSGIVVDHWPAPGWYGGVKFSGHSDYGGTIVIKQSNGLTVRYAHLSRTRVCEGDIISKGEYIGNQGKTGLTDGGEHLHLEIMSPSHTRVRER